ncbi:MAG: L-threonylcarbamoyladenylate synthase [Anaerovoracaceae bacterium]|nr:L-threonylcarbamoyladenylate synthase [Anaerovoracaceae bacterium]
MKTRILEPTAENIREAGRALSEGKLVAFPTETVYGLGADAFNEDAVKAVYAAKGRPSDNPMIVHISDVKQLEMLASSPNNDVYKLAGRLWPGPLTMIVKKVEGIPDATTGGLDTVGVRMPSDEIARALIDAAGCPVAAPSANISGRPSPTMAQHVIDDMSGRIDYIIKGADCRVGIESTVVDMTGDTPVILRPGIVTREQISEILSKDVEIDPAVLRKSLTDESFVPKAPGMKYRHYAPEADMIVFSGRRDSVEEQIRRVKKENEDRGLKVGVILFDDNDSEEAARKFFAELRRMDAEKVQLILAGALSGNDEVGFAVMNRMLKSAGYNVQNV